MKLTDAPEQSNFTDTAQETSQPDTAAPLPHSMRMEFALLGSFFFDNSQIDHLNFLSPEHFYTPQHQQVFAEMLKLRADGKPVTPFSVAAQMVSFEGITVKYLTQTLAAAASIIRPAEEARMLIDMAERRNLITACLREVELIRKGSKSSSEHIADLGLALENSTSTGGMAKFLTSRQVSDMIIADLKTPQKPFSTGINRLDAAMEGGMYPGMAYLIAGRKKMGKTTLAGTISHNLNQGGVRHLYIAAEMGIKQIHQRNLSRMSATTSNCFRNNYGRTAEFQQKLQTAVDLSQDNTLYLNAPGIRFDELKRSVAQAISIYKIKGFVLDSLQLVRPTSEKISQAEHQDQVSQWVADYGREHNIFTLTTAQMNQTGNIRGGEGVRMACDMGFEIHAPEDDPSISSRWLEMIETRYTEWANVGTKTAPGLLMSNNGPFMYDPEQQEHLDL